MKKTAKKIVAGTVGAAGLFLASAATTANADSVHHVVKNDTVWALSQKFGVSIKSIEQLNHIDQNTNMIYVGQDLQIPNKDTQTPKNNTHTYTVQSGDSLWAIAQKFNTSVDHLKQLNGLTSNLIYVGQTLKVDGQAVAQPAKAATPAPAKTVAQPVQQQAPVTKASVASTTQKAAPVQQAQQPSAQSTVKSTPAVQSTVKQAPVVSSVSSATPASSATQAQPATSSVATSKVAPAVSSSQAPVSSFASSASVSSSSASQQTVASSSSSQTSIASSVSSAAPASSVSSQSSSKQPVIAANHTTATVKSGDSLYTIAQEYGVSVASLREANPNLGNSLIVGQSLIVNNPTKNPAAASSSSQQAQASSASSQQQAPQAREAAAPQARTANSQQAAQSNNNQQQNNNNQAAQASSQAQQSSTTRTGSGNNVVSYAESFIGVPYVYGGTTPSGFDCSGFVQYVYNHFGKSLPRTTTQQENCGTQIPVSQAQPGDLYFWGNKGSAYHVAICVGNGKYIAAPEPGQSVSIGSTQYFQPSFAVRL